MIHKFKQVKVYTLFNSWHQSVFFNMNAFPPTRFKQ